tara:strand:+ start:315 stop:743 length:429 start_codon:yes stop_codon:yes gene_type:complete
MGADPFSRYGVGVNNVGSYQVSGLPWITGSSGTAKGQETQYLFPRITKSVTVISLGSEDIRVHFNSTSSLGGAQVITGLHYVTLNSAEDSLTMNVKVDEIYISTPGTNGGNASWTVVAELTNILPPQNWVISGSGLTTLDGT